MSPAQALRAARERSGLNITEAAERLGVSRQSFSRWENGHLAPAPDRIQQIVDGLGMSVEEAKALGDAHPSVRVFVASPAA